MVVPVSKVGGARGAVSPNGFFPREGNMSQGTSFTSFVVAFCAGALLDVSSPGFGDPLPGLTAGELTAFELGLDAFEEIETVDDGLAQEHWRPKYIFHYIQDRYFNPSFVYDITPVFEQKLASVKAYSSQFFSSQYGKDEPQTYISTPGFLNAVIGRHQMFGKMIGTAYAEGFITEKMIGVRDFDAFIQLDT